MDWHHGWDCEFEHCASTVAELHVSGEYQFGIDTHEDGWVYGGDCRSVQVYVQVSEAVKRCVHDGVQCGRREQCIESTVRPIPYHLHVPAGSVSML